MESSDLEIRQGSSVYIEDSEFVDNDSLWWSLTTIYDTSELTLERCTFQRNFSFAASGAITVFGAKLIVKGDENKFLRNRSITNPAAHIQVRYGGEVSGCQSTTFLAPSQRKGVVD
jgi:hypothetical protein